MWYLVDLDQDTSGCGCLCRFRSGVQLENLPCLKSLAGTEACVDSIRSHVDGGCLVDFGQASSDELAPHRGAGV
ncbi:hypothetical protein CBS147343_6318 [Aspergillus niger]|nr:hypothetical protein CBS133816_8807 [Aspergillus niger]KAI2841438.1 hypothetical protein CBS11232_8767 [Aspergillus niger]KAI2849324.1 hypothetical protein CBS12448_8913 [Aspergillus niger]KAI2853275.1 hypothetical protein CBS11350_13 [Aspergillus niger]KAI2877812.1 hypothetical protein CBS115988_3718 [Aspergillus niger]